MAALLEPKGYAFVTWGRKTQGVMSSQKSRGISSLCFLSLSSRMSFRLAQGMVEVARGCVGV